MSSQTHDIGDLWNEVCHSIITVKAGDAVLMYGKNAQQLELNDLTSKVSHNIMTVFIKGIQT